ncbi:MAG: hypothetical protein BM565_10735 [Gammaproteobacteria bacterium MedPE]|nr:MAG: hypothetical protein BM565_10735 [Gammaproteobacteria bacterium MedPE]
MLKTKPSIIATAVLLSLGLSACGGSSNSSTPAPTPTPTNTAPTAVALSASDVAENAVAATIGTLTATDADAGDTFTYTVDDERFEVSGNELKLKANESLNYELIRSIPLKVTVTDSGSATFTQDLTVNVTDSMGVQTVLDALNAPETYTFESQFEAGESAVSYSGQTARQVLILELNNYIGSGLQADLDVDKFTTAAQVKEKLMSLYAKSSEDWQSDIDNDTVLAITSISVDAPLTVKQAKITDISSSHKNLQAKVAGNDEAGQTKDWSTDLVGWNDKGSVTPNGVVEQLFDQLAANAQKAIDGELRKDFADNTITKVYVNEDGTDIKQLVQKFLLGALNFSQGTDDYLDNTTADKGLLSSFEQDGTKNYTKVEHQFDEGFGYFGAARNYNAFSDLDIRAKGDSAEFGKGYNDADTDGTIDLKSEINLANSVNAAKRDLGTADNTTPTDFTKTAFDAFVKGRKILNDAAGRELTSDEMTTLLEQRDTAVLTWEKAISATVIHYINDTKADLDKIGTDGYTADNFADLAKHWSELKGFSLNLQFSPFSPVTDEEFAMMQEKIGMKPVVVAADVAAYKTQLDEVRTMLQNAYHFDAENVEKW